MFQFRRFPAYAYFVQRTLTEYCSAGFPHSVILGSKLMCSSPRLIAACHDLLRLLMPRHSPCALISLTFVEQPSKKAVLVSIRIMQASVWLHCSFCYPNSYIKVHKSLYFVTSLLLARNFLLASLFSFQGADFQPFSRSDRNVQTFAKTLRFDLVVEISGIEPLTPCLQGRCSPS